ncbi:winged helix-turn-helix transcriptional regulator [Tateyamaria sp. SN3-11]|uniref:winged helix-turn-helix transcriptional regulator n=1 Tax=Tateyamaria sp. SN3-11 TaxID=3092147 RepID=UPI0039E7EAF9
MALFDLLGRSWAQGVIWQLAPAPLTFRKLQEACDDVSPTVLNRRLKELREAGIVDHHGQGYGLTPLGQDLFQQMKPLDAFSHRWAEAMQAKAAASTPSK